MSSAITERYFVAPKDNATAGRLEGIFVALINLRKMFFEGYKTSLPSFGGEQGWG